MALRDDHDRGFVEALQRYGFKHAGWGDALRGVGHDLVGHPVQAVKQIAAGTAFKPEGLLNPKNVLWGSGHVEQLPTDAAMRGPRMALRGAMPWVSRAFTVGLPAYEAYKGLKGEGDPREGRLSNVLGAIGSGAGWAFGQPIAGMLGAPVISGLGRSLGVGVGRLLGSRPQPQQPQSQVYPVNPPQGAYDGTP